MTNEQILEIAEKHFDYQGGWLANTEDLLKFARELCDKRQKPVPVSERLPGPEDCDGEGRCWWGEPQIGDSHDATWNLCSQDDAKEFLTWRTKCGWLPANALPLPAPEGGEVKANG